MQSCWTSVCLSWRTLGSIWDLVFSRMSELQMWNAYCLFYLVYFFLIDLLIRPISSDLSCTDSLSDMICHTVLVAYVHETCITDTIIFNDMIQFTVHRGSSSIQPRKHRSEERCMFKNVIQTVRKWKHPGDPGHELETN